MQNNLTEFYIVKLDTQLTKKKLLITFSIYFSIFICKIVVCNLTEIVNALRTYVFIK